MEDQRAADDLQVRSRGEAMSDLGVADVPRESGETEWAMFHTEVEGGRSAGAGARVTFQGRSGSSCPGEVRGATTLLREGRGGTEGLMGDSDNWVVLMAGDWGRVCRPMQKPPNDRAFEIVWRGCGRGGLSGASEIGRRKTGSGDSTGARIMSSPNSE